MVRAVAPPRRSLERAWLVLLVLLAGCGKARPAPSGAPSAAPPPPPRPPGLMATLSVPNPSALYAGVRALGGGSASGLPESAELALAATIELPPIAAGQLLLDRPLVGALIGGDGRPLPALVVALAVRSGSELGAALGSSATGAPTVVPGLVPLASAKGPALAVLGNWLLVSSDATAIVSAAPYVTRVLAARPPAAEALRLELDAEALHGPVPQTLRASWRGVHDMLAAAAEQARAAQGRPPDFGDPGAILAGADARVGALLQFVEASRSLALTGSVAPDRVELALELVPDVGGVAERATRALASGPVAPLLGLPLGAKVAALVQFSESELDAVGNAADAWTSLELPSKDVDSLRSAAGDAARGMGSPVAVGLLADETVVLRSPLRDPGLLERSVLSLVRAARTATAHGPAQSPLRAFAPSDRLGRVAGLPAPAHELTLVPRRGSAPGLKAAWAVRERELVAAGSPDPRAVFGALVATPAPPTLAADPRLVAMLGRRMAAAVTVYADLAGKGSAPAPVAFACGRQEQSARAELELSGPAVGLLLGKVRGP